MFQKYSQDEAQALVKALKEGNQLAFSIVYKTYAAQSFSLAFKYLLNKELAEDAVQNLFLKLWLRKEEIDETKPINRYLFTMLKNDLLNTLRDSKKNICLLEDCLSMVLELEDNSLNENLKQEQMNIIQQALDQLSPQRRKVFEMKVSGKYSNQEIADKYNPQIQIAAESGTKRSIFRQKNKTKRSKNRLHTTLIKPEQKVNEDLCSGFVLS